MLERLFRLITRTESSATFGEFAIRFLKWLGILGGGGMSAWAAAASKWLDTYGPIAWVLSGLLGALLVSLVILVIAKAASWWAERRLYDLYSTIPKNTNPLEPVFRHQRISLSDFESPFVSSYKGKTFENCDIIGPGTMFIFGHSAVGDNQFFSCDFVELGENKMIASAIGLEDCVIRNCRLYKVAMLMQPGMKKVIDKETPGANWITP